MLAVQAGRQDLVMQREGSFQHSRSARGALEMANVRLHRAQCHGVGRKICAVEHIDHALGFDNIAHTSRSTVAFNQCRRSQATMPAFCQARSTQNFCPIGLGAVIPLPLPSLDPPMPRSTA